MQVGTTAAGMSLPVGVVFHGRGRCWGRRDSSACCSGWEHKTLRHRLFTIAATLARTSRQRLLHIKDTAAWAALFTTAWNRLAALAPP